MSQVAAVASPTHILLADSLLKHTAYGDCDEMDMVE